MGLLVAVFCFFGNESFDGNLFTVVDVTQVKMVVAAYDVRGKITIGIGRGSKTTRSDLTLDSYSVIPGNNLAHNSGEILDITFDNIRDTQRNGYTVRVREIYALTAADGWKVKTTTSFIPASHNEPIPSIVNKIIYHQRTQYKFESEYISYGSLYLLTGVLLY